MSSSPLPISVVVAHGAYLRAAQYNDFSKELAILGMEAVVPQLPSSSTSPPSDAFAADVEVLRSSLCMQLSAGRDVILLTHSYGGLPGCEALKDLPEPCAPHVGKVLGIVFVSAFVAEEGQSLATAKESGQPADWVRLEGGLTYVDDAEGLFFNSIEDPGLRSSLAASVAAHALSAFTTTVSYAGWRHYPTLFIRCEDDRAQPVDEQDHFITRLKTSKTFVGQTDLERADHCPHATMPRDLAMRVSWVKEVFDRMATTESVNKISP